MPSLSETQARVRAALVTSAFEPAAPLLVGGAMPSRRLALHHRHYHASLRDTLRSRFPATAWLIGDGAVSAAAAAFVVEHPPRVFCMAEFGDGFPAYLAVQPGLAAVPYLEAFARLEWEVGRVSVAVSDPALDLTWLQAQDPGTIGTMTLTLQPGLAWLRSSWSVGALMQLYLAGDHPDAFTMHAADTWTEVYGARGTVDVRALSTGVWHFRRALAEGDTIEVAAGAALDADPSCDPGGALVHLIVDGLVTGARRLSVE